MLDHGDNQGPKSADYYNGLAQTIKENAERWLDLEVTDKNADLLTADINEAAKVRKEIEADRKALVEPFLVGQRKINDDYNPLKHSVTNSENDMKAVLGGYLKALKQKQEEEARQARAAAEKAKREAEILAEDPEIGREVQRDAYKAEVEAKRAERQTATAAPVDGGRSIGLKKRRSVVITDVRVLVAHYATHPDMVDLAEKLANREIRAAKGAAIEIPGVRIEVTEVA